MRLCVLIWSELEGCLDSSVCSNMNSCAAADVCCLYTGFILCPPADPPLHLHRRRGHHECHLLGSAGSEKPWCLVRTSDDRKRTFMLHRLQMIVVLNHFLLLFSITQMGPQEQPRALEQDGAQSAVQSNSLKFSHRYWLFCFVFIFLGMAAWKDNSYLFCYLASKSILPSAVLTVYMCVVCFQLFTVNMDYSKLKKDRPDF